ncbi:hypothetical protein BHS06_25945 [Myxococcus xanthus]|nr:hypothetical protein BHS06_25945 [Myxococcus xanthus]
MEELVEWLMAAQHTLCAGRKDVMQLHDSRFYEQLATSVLVAGGRGAGKTTLLLTLASALKNAEYLGKLAPDKLKDNTNNLSKRIFILAPLDMDPLLPETNLLASLLVHIRDALTRIQSGQEQGRISAPLLQEEGLADPWGTIDQLVRDATFMWEDIPVQGQDPRQRAEYQLRAAEHYASFRHRFNEAINSVSRYVAHYRLCLHDDEGVMLVLPIDNVDRSVQHLHLILKLTRMVASRKLWFILAAGRQEFQLFLERTFQKELSEFWKVSSTGNMGDETRAIARRQAAAAMRRTLPQTHRIEIDMLLPINTWQFHAPTSLTGESTNEEPLYRLLAQIPMAGIKDQNREPMYFDRIFDISRQFSPGCLPNSDPIFTTAAKYALTMSPRTALDLWQAARAACKAPEAKDAQAKKCGSGAQDPAKNSSNPQDEKPAAEGDKQQEGNKQQQTSDKANTDERAIDIAHRMLLMAIDESTLPTWASEQFLHLIIGRDVMNRIVLNLDGTPIRRLKNTCISDIIELPPPTEDHTKGSFAQGNDEVRCEILRSELQLRHFQDVALELHDAEQPGRTVALPPNVSGWFMILHDLLAFTSDQRIISTRVTRLDATPEMVVTQHDISMNDSGIRHRSTLDIWWIPPEWETFFDFAIFTHQWDRCFSKKARTLLNRLYRTHDPKELEYGLRLVRSAWIGNVLSVCGSSRGQWEGPFAAPKKHGPESNSEHHDKSPPASDGGTGISLTEPIKIHEEFIIKYEISITQVAEDIATEIQNSDFAQETAADRDRSRIAMDWIKHYLPIMRGPEFLPTPQTNPAPQCRTGKQIIETRRIAMHRSILKRSEAFQRYLPKGERRALDFLERASAALSNIWIKSD